MPEYIEREALIENIAKIEDLRTLSTKTIGEAISNTPAADVVEVVRCKDCKHRYELLCCYGEYDYGFCNYGERKE